MAAITLLVARPGGVFTALAGTATDFCDQGFMSWFGPKGVVDDHFLAADPDGARSRAGSEIFNLAALTVFCSIIVHGVTDTAGVRWIARRSERSPPAETTR